MKKALLLCFLATGVLTACTPTSPAYVPSPTVTGHWEGYVKKYAFSYKVTADLIETNSPNPGDFTGTVYIPDLGAGGAATGNVGTGQLQATDGSTVIACSGTFKDNAFYAANCTADGVSGSLTMTRLGPKN